MEMMEISKLKEHPRNREFFDDIAGERWDDFKESVVRRGVVEPIVVTQDLTIVSGHQRVRACKELGLLEIPCRIAYYSEYDERNKRTKEDMIIEDLISTNIMQRGVGNVNPMKMAKCIMELERLKNIGVGNNVYNENRYCQSDLAKEFNMTSRQLRRYKELSKLIPEFQKMIEDGDMKPTVASKIWAGISQDNQQIIFKNEGKTAISNMTEKDAKEYIKTYKRKSIPKSIESHLISRSNGMCEVCSYGGLPLIGVMEKHHITPISEGGKDDLKNLILLCPTCHKLIHILRKEKESEVKETIMKNIEINELRILKQYI